MILPDKCLKLLRLALGDANPHESANAAVMFMTELKKEGIDASRFEAIAPRPGFVRVKRHSDASPPSWAQCTTPPAQTPSRPSPAPKNNPYGAYEGEQLQWVYENRHRLSKKMRAAVEEEFEARELV
jgi:hypothetical protein